MRFADMASRVNEVAQRYQVPERVDTAKEKIHDLSSRAYRLARENPRTSVASAVLAAALVGGLLWWVFGDPKKPVQRRRQGHRVRAGTERRRRQRAQA